MGSEQDEHGGGIFPRGFSPLQTIAWPLVKSSEIIHLNYGRALKEPDRRDGGIPVYGTNGRCGWHDESLQKGPGVILGRKGQGPLGVEWCDTDFWVIDTAYFAIPKTSEVDLRYFYYLVKYIGLNHLKDGTSNPSLSRDTFADLLLPVPPLQEQLRIAHIVKTLDDKIELNRRMNATLEALARALFKSWFVDFDPVRAKMDGRQPAGMDRETARLFPDRLEHVGDALSPVGWSVEPLGRYVTVERGLSYKGSGLASVGFPLHNLNSVYEGGGYKFEGIKHYIGEYQQRHLVRPGDVVVANTEQGHDRLLIGYAAIVPSHFGEKGLFSHHLYRVSPTKNSPLTSVFVCQLLNSRRMHDLVSGQANGTTVNMLPMDAIERPLISVPPHDIVARFSDFAVNAFSQVERIIDENRILSRLRDTLLPKLLSGEVRVPEAERQLESTL